jgi:hypothetical protein
VGQTASFAATTTYTGNGAITWLTLDGDVATVSPSGLVTARKVGVADIVAMVAEKTSVRSSVRVTVTP